MLLSPVLRKITTAALLLPAAVLANSSYADCAQEKSYSLELEGDHWQVEYEPAHSQKHAEHTARPESQGPEKHHRLSRIAFYGEQAPVAIIEL